MSELAREKVHAGESLTIIATHFGDLALWAAGQGSSGFEMALLYFQVMQVDKVCKLGN